MQHQQSGRLTGSAEKERREKSQLPAPTDFRELLKVTTIIYDQILFRFVLSDYNKQLTPPQYIKSSPDDLKKQLLVQNIKILIRK